MLRPAAKPLMPDVCEIDVADLGVWGQNGTAAGPPQGWPSPLGGQRPAQAAERWGLNAYAYFSRILVERSTSRSVSSSDDALATASITVQAIMR